MCRSKIHKLGANPWALTCLRWAWPTRLETINTFALLLSSVSISTLLSSYAQRWRVCMLSPLLPRGRDPWNDRFFEWQDQSLTMMWLDMRKTLHFAIYCISLYHLCIFWMTRPIPHHDVTRHAQNFVFRYLLYLIVSSSYHIHIIASFISTKPKKAKGPSCIVLHRSKYGLS